MVRVDPIPSVNRAACADREATPSGRMSLLRKSALTRLAAPWHSLCGDRPSGDLAIRHLHLMSRTVAQGTARMACVGIHFATRMMRWLKRTCSRHASVACAAQQSAKGCRFGSCAAGRIGVATCLSILNLKQLCVRPTPDIPIPSRLKKLRDTLPSSPFYAPALSLHVKADVGSHHSRRAKGRVVQTSNFAPCKTQVTSWPEITARSASLIALEGRRLWGRSNESARTEQAGRVAYLHNGNHGELSFPRATHDEDGDRNGHLRRRV